MNIIFFQDKPLEPFGWLRHLAITRTSALPLVEVMSLLLPKSSFFVIPFHSKKKAVYREEKLLSELAHLEYPEFFGDDFFQQKKKKSEDFILLNARHTSDCAILKKTISVIKNLSVGQILVQEKTWVAGKFNFDLLGKDLLFSDCAAMDFFLLESNEKIDVQKKYCTDENFSPPRLCFSNAWEYLLYGSSFSTCSPEKFSVNLANQNVLRVQKGDLDSFDGAHFCENRYGENSGVWCDGETKNLIHPSVVFLNASEKNPIVLEKGVKIAPFSVIKAPFYAGVGAEIKPHAQISNSSLGKKSKIGGEVDSSVIDDYSNKAHHGFVGNSLLGSWVNVGAGTQFSNLKNLYSVFPLKRKNVARNENIPQKIDGKKMIFAGSLVGDFVRIAVNTNMLCGCVVKVGATLNDGFPLQQNGLSSDDEHCGALVKELPHFYWNDRRFYRSFLTSPEMNQYKIIHFEAIVHIQKMMFERRDCEQTERHRELLRLIYVRLDGDLMKKNNQGWKYFPEET